MEFPVDCRKAAEPCRVQKTHLTVVELKNVPDCGGVQSRTHLIVVEPRKNAPDLSRVKKMHLTVVEFRKRT
jgi:hypothetical protein